jgi:hypothetical protein
VELKPGFRVWLVCPSRRSKILPEELWAAGAKLARPDGLAGSPTDSPNPPLWSIVESAGIAWRGRCEAVSRVFDAAVFSRVGTGKNNLLHFSRGSSWRKDCKNGLTELSRPEGDEHVAYCQQS